MTFPFKTRLLSAVTGNIGSLQYSLSRSECSLRWKIYIYIEGRSRRPGSIATKDWIPSLHERGSSQGSCLRSCYRKSRSSKAKRRRKQTTQSVIIVSHRIDSPTGPLKRRVRQDNLFRKRYCLQVMETAACVCSRHSSSRTGLTLWTNHCDIEIVIWGSFWQVLQYWIIFFFKIPPAFPPA